MSVAGKPNGREIINYGQPQPIPGEESKSMAFEALQVYLWTLEQLAQKQTQLDEEYRLKQLVT